MSQHVKANPLEQQCTYLIYDNLVVGLSMPLHKLPCLATELHYCVNPTD